MASRAKLMRRLSALTTEELLNLLNDDTIHEVAQKFFDNSKKNYEDSNAASIVECSNHASTSESPPQGSHERAKRPLNAFMAFRSYYLKIFPDVPQKAASGFLTTLWSKDPFRNKWALIAKVYSFVRDEVGKEKVSLSFFLRVCCPAMKIVEPSEYLAKLGWSIQKDEAGVEKLVQDASAAGLATTNFQRGPFPSTEMDLLYTLIHVGYLPEDGHQLLGRLNTSSSSLMTTSSNTVDGLQTHTIKPEKNGFIDYVRTSPLKAAKDLYGQDWNESEFGELGVAFHEVKDVRAYIPTRYEWPDARPPYAYSTSNTHLYTEPCNTLKIEPDSNTATFNIDSPWDVDMLLGRRQQEGERDTGRPASQQYNPHQDYQFMF